MLRKRKVIEAEVRARERGELDDQAEAMFPVLMQFLTMVEWPEGGGRRVPGSILLMCEDGAWKAMVKDKDDPAVAFVSGASLEAVLLAVEAGLASGGLDWREDRFEHKGGRTPPRR